MIYALRQGRNVGGLVPISTVVQNVYANLNEMAGGAKRLPGSPRALWIWIKAFWASITASLSSWPPAPAWARPPSP
jgi:hypothetical protein